MSVTNRKCSHIRGASFGTAGYCPLLSFSGQILIPSFPALVRLPGIVERVPPVSTGSVRSASRHPRTCSTCHLGSGVLKRSMMSMPTSMMSRPWALTGLADSGRLSRSSQDPVENNPRSPLGPLSRGRLCSRPLSTCQGWLLRMNVHPLEKPAAVECFWKLRRELLGHLRNF